MKRTFRLDRQGLLRDPLNGQQEHNVPKKARDAMIVSIIFILQRTAQMILQRRRAIGWDAYTRAGFARSDRGDEP